MCARDLGKVFDYRISIEHKKLIILSIFIASIVMPS